MGHFRLRGSSRIEKNELIIHSLSSKLFLLSYSPIFITSHRRLPLKISQRRAISAGWLLHQKYARTFWAHPSPPLSSTICYLLTPLFYLITSKSSDEDALCSIYDKILHFITYIVDLFIQGQISNLRTFTPKNFLRTDFFKTLTAGRK